MCGIFGCVGEKNVSSLIIKGLKRLEYRGYDSAGLCLEIDSGNFEILKSSNSNYPVDVLNKSLEKSKISSNAGIGHTRWATHGPINNINTHPLSPLHLKSIKNLDDKKYF